MDIRGSSEGLSGSPGLVSVPGWDRFAWLRAGFSTREGGASTAYGPNEQNLGWTTEDDPRIVTQNRAAFALGVVRDAALPLVTVRQVHGATVRDLETEPGPWMTDDGKARMEGDGIISRTPGRLLAVLTADCVPVLVADTRTHAVAAFHAGWRGTLAGIVTAGIALMHDRYGSEAGDLIAAIGPCINACCFQVGKEVRAAFVAKSTEADTLFTRAEDGSLYLDLVEANRRQLFQAGLRVEAITALSECTSCSRTAGGARRYFSYRAEHGGTGRMLSGIAALQ